MKLFERKKRLLLCMATFIVASANIGVADTLPNILANRFPNEDTGEIKIKAEQGDVGAQQRYAELLEGSDRYVEAVEWYRKPAAAGVAEAQYKIGLLLFRGRPEMSKDSPKLEAKPREAVKWLTDAAVQNHGLAQFKLGQCFKDGEGTFKDELLAYKWFSLAADQWIAAQSHRDRLALTLSAEDIVTANNLVARFKKYGDERRIPGGCNVCREIAAERHSHKIGESSFYEGKIKIKGVIASKKNPRIMLEGCSLGIGEEGRVRVGAKVLKVKCVDINSTSALIEVVGVQPPLRIKF